MKTAWFLGHRIREMMKTDDALLPPMGGNGGIIEADETYVGRKAGRKVGRGTGHKHAVMGLVERNGVARSFHLPNVKADTLYEVLVDHVERETHLMTDEAPAYLNAGWQFLSHQSVKHSEDEYVRGNVHTNTVEGFFSIFKRGIYGIYQHVSEEHLKRYLVEFDFRYSNREKMGINDIARAEIALKGAKGKRLTYRTARGSRTTEAASV